MNKTAFIIPYFGKLPSYFHFFLHSCSYNLAFDFIFFTDLPVEEKENIKVKKLTLQELNSLASTKLGLKTNIIKPYKLCDFKPAYGKIFEDYLHDYTFWGSVDIDVILGKLSNFIGTEQLEGYDAYSGVKQYLSGSLFLFRNSEKMNNLYTISKDYKTVFQSTDNFIFDECGPLWHELLTGKDLFSLDCPTESITHVMLREEKQGNIRVKYTSDILEEVTKTEVNFSEKGIHMNGKEYISLHFIYLKTHYYFIIPNWKGIPSQYFIDALGIHHLKAHNPFYYLFDGNLGAAIHRKMSNIWKRLMALDFVPSRYK